MWSMEAVTVCSRWRLQPYAVDGGCKPYVLAHERVVACNPARCRPLLHAAAASATYGRSLYHIRLQPLEYHIRLQPLLHTAAVSASYGCSLCYIWLQPLPHTVAGLQLGPVS